MDLKELEQLISIGDFSNILGIHESEYFDCKRNIYSLEKDSSKFELAKDVSAFANAGGGYILIGIETKRSETSFYDEIIAIHPFKQNVCNHEQYNSVISDWIYPKLRDVKAKWYPTKEDKDKGIFVINIPNQPELNKPFLIKRTIQDTGKLSEVLFGFCERKQEANEPKTIVELHQILRDGLNLNTRLQSIEATLQDLTKVSPKVNSETLEIDKRIDSALSAIELTDKRAMVLTCYPCASAKLESLFSSKPGSMKSILESAPRFRERGFGLRVLGEASIVKGNFCRVIGGRRKVIDLYKDGVLIAGFKADGDFLCWAMEDLIFNPVALIETLYNFVQLYECVINDMVEKPDKVMYRIDFRNLHMDNEKNKLAEGRLGNHAFGDEIKPAPESNWIGTLEVEIKDFSIPRVSYNLAEMVYIFFQHDIEAIPYTKAVDGMKTIDVEQMVSL